MDPPSLMAAAANSQLSDRKLRVKGQRFAEIRKWSWVKMSVALN
jgi:hypothetical protein